MSNALLVEDVSRIKFLMGYDSSKLFSEHIDYNTNDYIISEQNPPAPKPAQPKQPAQNLTPQQIQAAKQKIQQVSTKAANSIFQELMKAFDMDGDRVLTDYDGTNERSAIAAIQKIRNRETLDALNRRVAMTKQFKDLKSWLNAEMSDFDAEYGQIWSKLEKMGYAGANRNVLLQYAGQTGVGQLVKSADKAIDQLRGMSFEDIMEGLRNIVNGAGGSIAQILIGAIPGIGQASVALLNGILFGWDMVQKSTGSKKFSWFNAVSDLLSTLLSFIPGGKATTAELQAAKPALEGATTLPSFFSIMSKNFPGLAKIFKSIGGKIATWGGSAVSGIRKGVSWLVSKLPFLKNLGATVEKALSGVGGFLQSLSSAVTGTVTKAVSGFAKSVPKAYKATSYLTNYGKTLTKNMGKGVFSKLETTLGKKVAAEVDKKIVEKIEDYLWENGQTLTMDTARPAICKMGPAYCATFDIMANVILVGKSAKELGKTLDKGGKTAKGALDKTLQASGRVKSGLEGVKTGVKATKQGVTTAKQTEAGIKQVQTDLAGNTTTQKTVAENSLNEEIQEIKRYISLI